MKLRKELREVYEMIAACNGVELMGQNIVMTNRLERLAMELQDMGLAVYTTDSAGKSYNRGWRLSQEVK